MKIKYNANKFYHGLKIIINNEPYSIENQEFFKPGKGQAIVRVKLRKLKDGKLIEKTLKSTDSVRSANILDINAIYLYNDAKIWYFMNKFNFEQIAIKKQILTNKIKWLSPKTKYTITLWNKNAISINIPNFINLTVIETEPCKNENINKNTKIAKLNNGIKIKIPLFVKNGNIIKIDTRNEKYVSRIK
ncbi:elongation factor P [Candidatus Purcelliella pentastirinorum]|uniref:Elongation factor P n=1 Tax=Candidatus Purcelliella pentastirinorum TaxID=472834 RepID=A0AAX3N8D0_9ENTR|nr:elongation factor P [Candidatus Purcelliella pentastirinorum]WDI78352.1 elongation factor P [Candidatus Purcelliella pentastirinorum]